MIHFQDHALLLNESYKQMTGEYLVEELDPGEVLGTLNEADQVVLSCGLEPAPVFNYGNVKALSLFGCDLSELIQTAVKEVSEDYAETLIKQVSTKNSVQYTLPYNGLIGKNDRQWRIDAGIVWLLKDSLGRTHGVGLSFTDWSRLAS